MQDDLASLLVELEDPLKYPEDKVTVVLGRSDGAASARRELNHMKKG